MARQKKSETPQEFADKCRNLAELTVPQLENADLQKLYYEQAERMLLASFTSGITGTPGRQVRFAMPMNLEEALTVAITLDQADLQERRDKALYLKSQSPE
jgi:acyl-coenzyme A synthetase/AMP-(fatty) acid ligase